MRELLSISATRHISNSQPRSLAGLFFGLSRDIVRLSHFCGNPPNLVLRLRRTKPNPPKDGDGKSRVRASSEKPRNDPSKDPTVMATVQFLGVNTKGEMK